MEIFAIQLFLVFFVVPCHGWFYDDTIRAPQASITQDCQDKAGRGDCSFYDCLVERYPCATRGFSLTYGKYYCEKMVQHYHAFHAGGQAFVDSSRKCLTQALLPLYMAKGQSCENIRITGIGAQSTCLVNKNFCAVMWPCQRSPEPSV